jgi:hypothetical protein
MGLLKAALQTLGFGTPFIFAAATYSFFHWLDKNASPQASQAISRWLKGEPYRRIDVKLGIISAFDNLYSSPLLSVKAFGRSFIVSSVTLFILNWFWAFIWISHGVHYSLEDLFIPTPVELLVFSMIIISDYLSLFVVRKLLTLAGDKPFLSLFLAITAGGFLVTGVLVTIIVIAYLFYSGSTHLLVRVSFFIENTSALVLLSVMSPAFLVHLWLPLFAIGALGVRAIYLFVYVARSAQWFFRQGGRHPVRAIGMAAAAFMVAGTTILRALPPVDVSLDLPNEFRLAIKNTTVTHTTGLYTVKADILNLTTVAQDVPRIRVVLLDDEWKELESKVIDPPSSQLAPGATVHFETSFERADNAATTFSVEFAWH